MKIEKANIEDVESIVDMSKRAFQTDIYVGGKRGDCPPDYDSLSWHKEMAVEGHLYKAVTDNKLVGAAILFLSENGKHLYIGRIFIDSIYHDKGYGIELMKNVEMNFPFVKEIDLDTPDWNTRTNSFYKKVGYKIIKKENGFTFYHKEVGSL